MAVMNPPRVIPGLGRSIVNFLIENRNSWDNAGLVEAFKPAGVKTMAVPPMVSGTQSAPSARSGSSRPDRSSTAVASSVRQLAKRLIELSPDA